MLLISLAVLHCGGEQTVEPRTPSEQLSLSPSNPQSAQGTAQQFTIRSLSEDGHLRDRTQQARWSVAIEGGSPLPMPADGLLELAEPGRYRVTAEYGNSTLATMLTVTTATLTSVAISPSAPKVAKGGSQSFVATAHFSDGTTQDVTPLAAWSIKDMTGTGVAVINTLGVANATNVGKARVSVGYKTHTASTTLQVTPATLLALSLSPSNPTIAKGSLQPFAASGKFSDGSVQDVTAEGDWAVSDLMGSGVAAINGLGVVTGQAVGQATVSAAYDGQVVKTTLTVTAAAVVSLAISPNAATLAKGTTQTFAAAATYSDGSRQDVTAVGSWTAADVLGTGVASVNNTGLATGNAVGTATIACSYRGRSASAKLQVTPAALTGLAVQPAAATVAKGLTTGFTVVGSYSDGSQQDLSRLVAWTAVDLVGTNVASVSATGLAVGKAVGKATVTAAYLGQSASGTLTVTAAILTSLAVDPGSPAIRKGTTQQFQATGSLSDGSKQDLTTLVSWKATDIAPASGVATVSKSGLATGNQGGQATILAQYLGLSAAATLTVQSGWVTQASGTTDNLACVWGSDTNNIWATYGPIQKWNGTTWTTQPNGATNYLFGVWGSDTNNVWNVGLDGQILKWNGTTWAAQVSGTRQMLYGVWGSDANNVWTVGLGGQILKWDRASSRNG